jgi:phospholipid transport system transporter-binding protein
MSVLALPQRLTHADAQALVDGWTARLPAAADGVLTLDAQSLAVFDSSAVAAILALRRLAIAQGARLCVMACPPRLMALADLYGVADWFRP